MTDLNSVASTLKIPEQTLKNWQQAGVPLPRDPENAQDVDEFWKWLANNPPQSDQKQLRSVDLQYPQWVLNCGFASALVLSFTAFIAVAVHLYRLQTMLEPSAAAVAPSDMFLANLNMGARLITSKMAMLAGGMMSGAALAFLGLALFLIGIRSAMNVDASGKKYQATLTQVTPGTLIILCSLLLIGICATRSFQATTDYQSPLQQDPPNESANAREEPTDPAQGSISSSHVDIRFTAPLTLVDALNTELFNAQDADEPNDRKRRLDQIWFFAKNTKGLVTEYKGHVEKLTPHDIKKTRMLEATNKMLNTLIKAQSEYDDNAPMKTIEEMKNAVRDCNTTLAQSKSAS